jgi:hypothetical protein
MMPVTPQGASCGACFRVRFSFALDLKLELKRGFKNVLCILLGNIVGTGSIKISRTVLPGWDPDKNKLE